MQIYPCTGFERASLCNRDLSLLNHDANIFIHHLLFFLKDEEAKFVSIVSNEFGHLSKYDYWSLIDVSQSEDFDYIEKHCYRTCSNDYSDDYILVNLDKFYSGRRANISSFHYHLSKHQNLFKSSNYKVTKLYKETDLKKEDFDTYLKSKFV